MYGTYGSEIWHMKAEHEVKLNRTEMSAYD